MADSGSRSASPRAGPMARLAQLGKYTTRGRSPEGAGGCATAPAPGIAGVHSGIRPPDSLRAPPVSALMARVPISRCNRSVAPRPCRVAQVTAAKLRPTQAATRGPVLPQRRARSVFIIRPVSTPTGQALAQRLSIAQLSIA